MTFNIKPQIIIGIDPDVEASGLGIINTTSAAGLLVDYMTLPLPKLVEQLEAVATTDPGTPVRIFIEAGWLNKGNWHLNPHDNKQLAAAKGRQAGRNHQLGLDLCALLDHRGIPHTEARRPATGMGEKRLPNQVLNTAPTTARPQMLNYAKIAVTTSISAFYFQIKLRVLK